MTEYRPPQDSDFILPRPRVTQAQLDAQRRKGWPDFHPEDFCHRCGGVNVSWHTDSATWNAVMRPTGETGRWGEIVCPTCFVELAGCPHATISVDLGEVHRGE